MPSGLVGERVDHSLAGRNVRIVFRAAASLATPGRPCELGIESRFWKGHDVPGKMDERSAILPLVRPS
jgi:hypothetical protein